MNEYLYETYGEAGGNKIIADIDRRYVYYFYFKNSGPLLAPLTNIRISAVPAFPGLRRFPDGRDFLQWTGDDSKALMKVSTPHGDDVALGFNIF